MATMRRIPDEDVRAIFESLHGTKQPPPHLKFQIVPGVSHGLKLSPPSYEFEDGLYVLLRPAKKKRKSKAATEEAFDTPKIPAHLKHLELKKIPTQACPWSLSGPQFPAPTAIQQRYCYPKGNAEYAGRKGGALWTMYGVDGKEDHEYRLLHVYFSAKRAVNKGMAISEGEKKVMEQQMLSSTPKKRRKNSAATNRMKRSSWQQRQDGNNSQQQNSSASSSANSSPSSRPMISGPPSQRNTRYSSARVLDAPNFLPPPSPCSVRKRKRKADSPPDDKKVPGDSIFVSPHTLSSTSRQGSGSEDDDGFTGRHFHPVASFEERADAASIFRPSTSGRTIYSDIFRNPNDRKGGGTFYSHHRRVGREHHNDGHDGNANVGGVFDDALDWNDPLFPNIMSSADHIQARPTVQEDPCVALSKRLHAMQKSVTDSILLRNPSEQGAMVAMVANWAKEVAKSPLLPRPGKYENDVHEVSKQAAV